MHSITVPGFAHNRRFLSYLTVVALVMMGMSSCRTSKESYYFNTLQKDTTLTGFISNDFESKIRVGDNLSIVATSLSKEEDALFNQAAGEITSNGSGVSKEGFLVRPDGTILIHRLGNITAAGYTRKELATQLQKSLLPYMKDPIVNVNYLNHKITVLGAVGRPQVINLPEEQLSLLDVIVSSGDVTAIAKKSDIVVIREIDNQKKIKHLNLEDHSIFSSPWYYLQPNDIVYVMPDKAKIAETERRTRIQGTLALVASSLSLVIIVLDRIIK